jgi:hypothetical protein
LLGSLLLRLHRNYVAGEASLHPGKLAVEEALLGRSGGPVPGQEASRDLLAFSRHGQGMQPGPIAGQGAAVAGEHRALLADHGLRVAAHDLGVLRARQGSRRDLRLLGVRSQRLIDQSRTGGLEDPAGQQGFVAGTPELGGQLPGSDALGIGALGQLGQRHALALQAVGDDNRQCSVAL